MNDYSMLGIVWTCVVLGVPIWAVVLTAIWAGSQERRADARRVLLIVLRKPAVEQIQENCDVGSIAHECRPAPRGVNNEGAPGSGRATSWTLRDRGLGIAVTVLLSGLVVLLWRGDLDRNDKIASVVGLFVSFAGLVVSVIALRARRRT